LWGCICTGRLKRNQIFLMAGHGGESGETIRIAPRLA
jgi:hypothetical protein